jgi:3,4-dihydroxy-2-butanone 4-phosphate synthase
MYSDRLIREAIEIQMQYEQGRRPGSEHGLEAASTYTEAKMGQTEHTQ